MTNDVLGLPSAVPLVLRLSPSDGLDGVRFFDSKLELICKFLRNPLTHILILLEIFRLAQMYHCHQ